MPEGATMSTTLDGWLRPAIFEAMAVTLFGPGFPAKKVSSDRESCVHPVRAEQDSLCFVLVIQALRGIRQTPPAARCGASETGRQESVQGARRAHRLARRVLEESGSRGRLRPDEGGGHVRQQDDAAVQLTG